MTFLSIFLTLKLDDASIAPLPNPAASYARIMLRLNSSANDFGNPNEYIFLFLYYHSVPTNLHLKYCSG